MSKQIIRFVLFFLAFECVVPALMEKGDAREPYHSHFQKKETASIFSNTLLNTSLEEKGEEETDPVAAVVLMDFTKLPVLLSRVHTVTHFGHLPDNIETSRLPVFLRICLLQI